MSVGVGVRTFQAAIGAVLITGPFVELQVMPLLLLFHAMVVLLLLCILLWFIFVL